MQKITPTEFASEELPLRASSLNAFMKCQGFSVFDLEEDRPVGKAAHTGTAVGRAIELYHRGEENTDALNQVRREALTGVDGGDPFPKADWSEVEAMFNSYTDDDRNPRGIVVKQSLEEEVTLRLPAHESDPTGKDIVIPGHIDQVRFEDGVYSIWDIKSGKGYGLDMVREYMFQQCAYTVAYKQKYPDRRVTWGGIIRTRGYTQQKRVKNPNYDPSKKKNAKGNSKTNLIPYPASSAPVFFASPFRRADITKATEHLRRIIARVRSGEIILTPGGHCNWCHKSGFHDCYPDLEERGFSV